VGRLLALLKTRGFRKGVLGNDRTWFALWVGLTAAGLVRRLVQDRPGPTERFTLKPGQALVVKDTGATWSALDAAEGG
jgi:hypothetical protein